MVIVTYIVGVSSTTSLFPKFPISIQNMTINIASMQDAIAYCSEQNSNYFDYPIMPSLDANPNLQVYLLNDGNFYNISMPKQPVSIKQTNNTTNYIMALLNVQVQIDSMNDYNRNADFNIISNFNTFSTNGLALYGFGKNYNPNPSPSNQIIFYTPVQSLQVQTAQIIYPNTTAAQPSDVNNAIQNNNVPDFLTPTSNSDNCILLKNNYLFFPGYHANPNLLSINSQNCGFLSCNLTKPGLYTYGGLQNLNPTGFLLNINSDAGCKTVAMNLTNNNIPSFCIGIVKNGNTLTSGYSKKGKGKESKNKNNNSNNKTILTLSIMCSLLFIAFIIFLFLFIHQKRKEQVF